jgi:hypothetical protein
MGPVDYIAIAFPGNKFSGAIIPEIKRLQDSGTIRVLDLVIITKDGEGNVAAVELQDAGPEEAAALQSLGIHGQNLLGQEDFEDFGEALDLNSTCGLLVWENVWAAPFVDTVRDADGIMLAAGRIPADVVEETMALAAS